MFLYFPIRLKKGENMNKNFFLVLIIATSLYLAGAQEAASKPEFLKTFEKKYPEASGSRIDACILCHVENPDTGTSKWNPFGSEFKTVGGFAAMESQDSDGDGFSNIEEIHALTFPGNASDHPMVTNHTTTAPPDVNKVEKTPGFEAVMALIALLAIYGRKKL